LRLCSFTEARIVLKFLSEIESRVLIKLLLQKRVIAANDVLNDHPFLEIG